jgi:hypothetical protein
MIGNGPDQGRYEERYRLTVPVARSAAFGVVPLIIALFSHQPLLWRRAVGLAHRG